MCLRALSRIRPAWRIPLRVNMHHASMKWVKNSRRKTPIKRAWIQLALSISRAVVTWRLNRSWKIALAQSNLSPLTSLSWAATSSRVSQRRSVKIQALVATCTTSLWKIRCGRWVFRCVSATRWIPSAQVIRVSSTKNRPRNQNCRLTWTMAWYQSRTKRSWRNDSPFKRPLNCTKRCKRWCPMLYLDHRSIVNASHPVMLLNCLSRTGLIRQRMRRGPLCARHKTRLLTLRLTARFMKSLPLSDFLMRVRCRTRRDQERVPVKTKATICYFRITWASQALMQHNRASTTLKTSFAGAKFLALDLTKGSKRRRMCNAWVLVGLTLYLRIQRVGMTSRAIWRMM